MKLKQIVTAFFMAIGTVQMPAQDAVAPEAVAEQVADSDESVGADTESTVIQDSGEIAETIPVVPDDELLEVELPEATVISNLFTAYIDAMGGERALRRVKSRVVKGTYENGDQKSDFELHQSRDGEFLVVLQASANTSRMGFDGKIAWRQSGDSKWSEMSETEAYKQKYFNSLNGFINWQEFYTTTRLLSDIEINARPVKVVLAENESGVSRKIYFDVQNSRVVRVDEEVADENTELVGSETYFKDYRKVDDVVVPFLEESVLPGSTASMRILSIEQDLPLQSGLFSPPKAGRTAGSGTRDTERFFDNLTISGVIYTNVWIHRQTNFNILIRHSQGIQTIRLTDLPKADLEELRPQIGDLANIEKDRASVVTDKWGELTGNVALQEKVRSNMNMATDMIALVLIPFLLGWLVAHLIWSYIIKRLCDRTKTKGGIACWIPFVQMAPMLRAAGFSDKWLGSAIALIAFPALLVTLAPLMGFNVEPGSLAMMMMAAFVLVGWLILVVASLMWPFKICSRCQKNPVLGLLMFVPVANIGVILYLAFSKES